MTKTTSPARGLSLLAAAALMTLAACATVAPAGLPLGTPIAQARGALFGPNAEYTLPGGGTRLEFDQGAFGKQTWMLDFDRAGVLVASQQVLTERNLATIAPGMSADEVRMRFGRPAWVFGVRYPRAQVWNYRFDGGDCVWYQVSIGDADQKVVEAGIGQDPACDRPNRDD